MASRIPLEPRLATYVEERIARFGDGAPPRWRELSEDVARFGALPLHAESTEALGIRPDGELVRWSTASSRCGPMPIDSPVDAAIALLPSADNATGSCVRSRRCVPTA